MKKKKQKQQPTKWNLQINKWLLPAEEEACQRAPEVSRSLTFLTPEKQIQDYAALKKYLGIGTALLDGKLFYFFF